MNKNPGVGGIVTFCPFSQKINTNTDNNIVLIWSRESYLSTDNVNVCLDLNFLPSVIQKYTYNSRKDFTGVFTGIVFKQMCEEYLQVMGTIFKIQEIEAANAIKFQKELSLSTHIGKNSI